MKRKKNQGGPLTGIKVLDLSRVLAGPLCTQHLADLGASVLKVESPDAGDETRAWGPPFHEGVSAYFLSCNRGKAGVRLDLKTAAGKAKLRQLVAKSDVVVENFRPQSLKRLGLSSASLRRMNPRLIHCSISGFGRKSPWADQAGYDFIAQGLSGMMAITGEPNGEPCKVGVAIADVLTSLYASTAICAALSRTKSRRGCHIDMALMDCILASQVNLLQSFFVTGKAPRRYGNSHHQIVPYQVFSAQDGPLIIAVGNDRQFKALCEIIEANAIVTKARYLKNSDRVKHREELVEALQKFILKHKRSDLIDALSEQGIPAGPILSYDQFNQHPFMKWWLSQSDEKLPLIPSPFVIDGKRAKVKFSKELATL